MFSSVSYVTSGYVGNTNMPKNRSLKWVQFPGFVDIFFFVYAVNMLAEEQIICCIDF